MKKHVLKIICLVFIAMSCSAVSGAAAMSVIGEKDCNFGRYPAKERKEAVFKLRNTGDQLLKIISIRKTCGCAEAKCDKNELAPGETAELKAVVLADSIYGPYSKNVYVETNDPGMKFLALGISGDAVPVAEIRPKSVVFAGRLEQGKAWKQDFLLEPAMEGVEFGEPVVDCKYPVSLVAAMENRQKRLSVSFTPDAEYKDDMNCRISVPVLKPPGWKNLDILIAGKVGVSAIAIPSTLYLPEPAMGEIIHIQFSIRILGIITDDFNPEILSWEKLDGADFTFGKPAGNTMPVTGLFSGDFIRRLSKEGQIGIVFKFQNTVQASLTLKPRSQVAPNK